MTYSKDGRILGLSRIWRDVKYNFARFYDITDDEKWDTLYQEYLPPVAEAEDKRRYYELLLRFINTLTDGHTYILVPDEIRPPYSALFFTSYVDGKHILTDVPKASSKLLGAEILAVNGIPLEKYLEKNIYPLAWHENKTFRFIHGILGYVIGCLESDGTVISTDKGDLIARIGNDIKEEDFSSLCSLSVFPVHGDISDREHIIESEELDAVITSDNIAVISFNSCCCNVKDLLYSNAEKLKDCSGYIIDVRKNAGGGDYSCSALASLFLKNYGTGGKFFQRTYDPNQQIKSSDSSRGYTLISDCQEQLNPPFVTDKPVAVLTGGYTASAAESFIIMMKSENRAALIGENSAGTNGMPVIFQNSLPGGGSYAICTMKCLTDEDFDYNNVGISPDIYCKNTVEDCQNGFDRVMDEGLKYIRSEVVKDN